MLKDSAVGHTYYTSLVTFLKNKLMRQWVFSEYLCTLHCPRCCGVHYVANNLPTVKLKSIGQGKTYTHGSTIINGSLFDTQM